MTPDVRSAHDAHVASLTDADRWGQSDVTDSWNPGRYGGCEYVAFPTPDDLEPLVEGNDVLP